jgi:hypothetical protein
MKTRMEITAQVITASNARRTKQIGDHAEMRRLGCPFSRVRRGGGRPGAMRGAFMLPPWRETVIRFSGCASG